MGKFYAVKSGRVTGIFDSWDKCKESVSGYSGANYKSFKSENEANLWLYGGKIEGLAIKKISLFDGFTVKKVSNNIPLDECIAYVDGSFEYDKFSYGCVLLTSDEEIQLGGYDNVSYLSSMHNIAGELLGAMVAIDTAIKYNKKRIMIYHDLEGTEKWANRKWNRNKTGTIQYEDFISNSRLKIDIDFTWVKGHSGIVYNEAADNLARLAIENNIRVDSRAYFGG